MAEEDVFRRAFEMGSAFFALTQKRAESMLQDLADTGESAKDQAQKVVDEAVEKGRQRSVEMVDLVRSEIRAQVAALGLATKDDIARLEAKLDAVTPSSPPAGGPGDPPTSVSSTPRRTASVKAAKAKRATGQAAAGKAATGKGSAAARSTGADTSATPESEPPAKRSSPRSAAAARGKPAGAARKASAAPGRQRRESPGAAPGDGPSAERT